MRAAVVVLVAGLALTSCSSVALEASGAPVESEAMVPAPTPTQATRPAVADLHLTSDGLGTLRMGGPLPDTDDPATAMVAWDPERCVNADYGIGADDPLAGGWAPHAAYDLDQDQDQDQGLRSAFQVQGEAGTLVRLDVYHPGIQTEGGVQVGDPEAAVLAAHPDAEVVVETPMSRLYQVHGTRGDLNIEVKVEGAGFEGYWAGSEGTVLVLRLTPTGSDPTPVAGGDNVIFGCGYTGP
jgi:hypothetical protein